MAAGRGSQQPRPRRSDRDGRLDSRGRARSRAMSASWTEASRRSEQLFLTQWTSGRMTTSRPAIGRGGADATAAATRRLRRGRECLNAAVIGGPAGSPSAYSGGGEWRETGRGTKWRQLGFPLGHLGEGDTTRGRGGSSLLAMESENAKILNAKGELSDENSVSYEKLWKSFDRLLRRVSSLAEALDMQPAVMPDDGHTTRVATGTDLSPPGKEFSVVEPIWDDEDTKAFYESLPDLRVFVPGVLLGEAEPKFVYQHGKVHKQTGESTLEQETDVQDNAETSAAEHQLERKANARSKNTEDREKSKEKDADKKGDIEREEVRVTDAEVWITCYRGCQDVLAEI